MNKHICLLSLMVLGSLVSAECKPGYQSATVVKVLSVSSGPSAPAPADEEEPSAKRSVRANARLVIFGTSSTRYGLRLPARVGSHDVRVAVGQEVCFRKEGKTIRVLTGDGKPLPGVAHPISQMPQSQ
jgi:hypothetical protein